MSSAVQVVAKTCAEVAQELVQQREFFCFHRDDVPTSERPLPDGPRYSGARSDDERTNLRVGAMRLMGFSDRAIERECAIDRRTIPHRLKWLEQAGRIPAQKERLQTVVGESAEKSGLVLNSLLDRAAAGMVDPDLAAMIRSVATAHGIAVDKLQLLTGGPTEIVQQVPASGRAEIERFWRDAAVPVDAQVVATESESSAEPAKPASSGADPTAGYPVATPPTPLEPEEGRGAGGVADPPVAGNDDG